MATWGAGSFENDQALDFVDDLLESDDFEFVAEALSHDPGEQVDACLGTDIVTAAEIIAATLGKPSEDCPQELLDWLQEQKAPPLSHHRDKALALLGTVGAEGSQLRQDWQAHGDELSDWLAVMDDLRTRLLG